MFPTLIILYFWRMIPQRIPSFLYIIFSFLILLSCQKKNDAPIKPKDTKAEVKRMIAIADNLFYDNNKLDSAFYYYNKAKFICNPITDADNYVIVSNCMAEIQQIHGDYAGSEATSVLPSPVAISAILPLCNTIPPISCTS